MTQISLDKARVSDAHELYANLRPADFAELCAASIHMQPIDSIISSIMHSDTCMTVRNNGRVALIFGVTTSPYNPKVGSPWMLATTEIKYIIKDFLRHAPNIIDIMERPYEYVTNVVYSGNDAHIRWIKWIGYTIDPDPVYRNGHKFYHFYRRPTACVDSV